METLVTVSVLVILAMVAVPNIVQMQKSLRAMELDAKAQQVFNAAQYNLTSLESAGQLYKLTYVAPATKSNDASIASEQVSLDALSVVGSGALDRSSEYNSLAAYSDGHDTDLKYGLYAAKDDNDTVKSYLATSIDNSVVQGVASGSYWIEFSPTTGEVYAVFYYEPGVGQSELSYGAMSENGRGDSSKKWRADNGVGYYGGRQISAMRDVRVPQELQGSGASKWSDFNLSIVNDEELYIRITGSDLDDPDKLKSLKLVVSATGLTRESWKWGQKSTWTRTYAASGNNSAQVDGVLYYQPGREETDVVLDSMREGMAISDVFPDMLPGSDISLSVRLEGEGQTIKELTFSTNSLYDSIVDGKAVITCVRHLNNLDLARKYLEAGYSETEMKTLTYSIVSFNGIVLKSDIDFDGTKWSDNSVSIESRRDFSGNGLNPLAVFEPITLPQRVSSNSDAGAFSGEGHVLKNFVIASCERDGDGAYVVDENGSRVIDESASDVGFVDLSSIGVKDIVFQDPLVIGGDNVGVLAGVQSAGSISNVHVYTTKESESGVRATGSNVGGLVGSVSQSGLTSSVKIEGCSSTIDVSGASYVGGLAGSSRSWTGSSNNYVGYRKTESGFEANRVPSIVSSGDYVGGVFGSTSHSNSNNHVLANVSGGSYVGGFAGRIDTGSSLGESTVGDSGGVYVCSVVGSEDNVGGVAGHCGSLSGSMSATYSYVNSVEGRDNVGGFSGTVAGGCGQCGVSGSVSSNGLMAQTTVSGRDNVGGFAGRHTGGSISGCYAATQVTSSGECAGGFIGLSAESISWVQSSNCYSSGLVVGVSQVGGFVGNREDGYSLENCYTTSNVKAKSRAGAFAGEFSGYSGVLSTPYWLTGLRAYGKLSPLAGADLSTFGGFVGVTAQKFSSYNTSTYYMSFEGYNVFPETRNRQPISRSYQECCNSVSNRVLQQYPLSSRLIGESFPFNGVTYNNAVLPHYGDWYTE